MAAFEGEPIEIVLHGDGRFLAPDDDDVPMVDAYPQAPHDRVPLCCPRMLCVHDGPGSIPAFVESTDRRMRWARDQWMCLSCGRTVSQLDDAGTWWHRSAPFCVLAHTVALLVDFKDGGRFLLRDQLPERRANDV